MRVNPVRVLCLAMGRNMLDVKYKFGHVAICAGTGRRTSRSAAAGAARHPLRRRSARDARTRTAARTASWPRLSVSRSTSLSVSLSSHLSLCVSHLALALSLSPRRRLSTSLSPQEGIYEQRSSSTTSSQQTPVDCPARPLPSRVPPPSQHAHSLRDASSRLLTPSHLSPLITSRFLTIIAPRRPRAAHPSTRAPLP